MKSLFDRGLTAEAIRQPFRVIDWLLELPRELEQQFQEEIHRFEEERKMPYVTAIERMAREEGFEEGHRQGREQGREQGRAQGREQGREAGSLLAVRRGFLRQVFIPLDFEHLSGNNFVGWTFLSDAI